jgi:hypothetical protein
VAQLRQGSLASSVFLDRVIDSGSSFGQVSWYHDRMNLDTCVECKEPRLSDGWDLRRILHLEENESRALTVVVGKITASGLKFAKMAWMVEPSLPALAATFPDSMGMLTFSKNRIVHLLRF